MALAIRFRLTDEEMLDLFDEQLPSLLERRPEAEIPTFKTLGEAAIFWDTHDFEDYVDNTEPVSFQVKIPRRTAKNIIRLVDMLPVSVGAASPA
jgi:hypothetical protein